MVAAAFIEFLTAVIYIYIYIFIPLTPYVCTNEMPHILAATAPPRHRPFPFLEARDRYAINGVGVILGRGWGRGLSQGYFVPGCVGTGSWQISGVVRVTARALFLHYFGSMFGYFQGNT